MRWLPALLLVTACASTAPSAVVPEATRAQVDALCHAEIRSGAISKFPFAAKAGALNRWLDQKLTDDALRLFYFEELPQMLTTDMDEELRKEAARHGVEPCPLAAYLEFTSNLAYTAGDVEACTRACAERNEGGMPQGELASACNEGCGGGL